MERKRIWLVALMIPVVALWAGGCGEEPSGPGSDGMVNTGSRIIIEEIQPRDGEKETITIDVVQDCCNPDHPNPPDCEEWEDFFDASFNVVMYVQAPNWQNDEGATSVRIEHYEVEFRSSSPGAVPIPKYQHMGVNLYLPGDGDEVKREGLPLLTAGSKDQWVLSGGDPGLSPRYEVIITFYGHNDFGYPVSVKGYTTIILANYDNC